MGDRTDELNLPLYSESGNVDKGHLSELAQNIEEQQESDLSNLVENYYSQHTSFIDLQEGLRQLGYSDARVESISIASHEERVYREQNQGESSDLSPNQLQALAEANIPLSNNRVRTDERGRQYVVDMRVRQVDGTRSRYYLPAPREFNPLTVQQQAQVNYLDQVGDDITITEDQATGENIDLTQDQRNEIMRLATNYLNSDPDMRNDNNIQFRNNIQHIQGIESVTNIRNILFDLFVDIDQEYEHRENNNGLPQNMTREQYSFLRGNPNLGWYGQPILIDPESGVRYYTTRDRGKTPLITQEQINSVNNIPQVSGLDIRPTEREENELNFLLGDWLNGDITNDEFRDRVSEITQYDPNDPLADPFRADMYANFLYSTTLFEGEREYRQINDGRPSQLTELQYNFLMNHQLLEGEERYVGQPVTIERGVARFRTSDGNLMLVPTDQQIQGFIDNNVFTPSFQLPSTDPIDIRVNPDRVITDDDLHGRVPLLPNRVVPPSNEDIREIVSGERQFDPEDPLGLGDIAQQLPPPPPLPTDFGELIILPEEIPSGEFIQNPFVRDYVGYVNSYESLYVGFREQFRDFLIPSLFSIAGGVVGYGFGVARQRLFINNVYSDMEKFINNIDPTLIRLRDINERSKVRVETFKNEVFLPTIALLETETRERGDLTAEGYSVLERLNVLRGQLAGTEDDPDLDAGVLMRDISDTAKELANLNSNIAVKRSEISRLEMLTNSGETIINSLERSRERLFDREESRREVITEYETNINEFYSYLFEVYQYRNEISIGVGAGAVMGEALSVSITGYFMPTAITDDKLDIPIPHNVKIKPFSQITDKEKKNKEKYNMILKGKFDKLDKHESQYKSDEQINYSKELERDNLELIQPKNINNLSVKILPKTEIPFRIIKDNGNKPLDYKQIQEYKSTLSKSELQELKNQYLIFGEGGQVLKVQDKCRGVYQDQSKVFGKKIGYR